MTLFFAFQKKNRSIRLVVDSATASECGAIVSAAEIDTSLSLMRTVSMTWM